MSNPIDPEFIKQQEKYVHDLNLKAEGYRDETQKLMLENEKLVEKQKEYLLAKTEAESTLLTLQANVNDLTSQVERLTITRESLVQELAQVQSNHRVTFETKSQLENEIKDLIVERNRLIKDLQERTSTFAVRETTILNNEKMQKVREDDLDQRLAVLNRKEQILSQK